MITDELNKVLEHNKALQETEALQEGATFLNTIATDPQNPHKDTLEIIALRIANDGDLLVPIGVSDVAAEVFGRHANRTYTGRRPWGDGVQEVFEYE